MSSRGRGGNRGGGSGDPSSSNTRGGGARGGGAGKRPRTRAVTRGADDGSHDSQESTDRESGDEQTDALDQRPSSPLSAPPFTAPSPSNNGTHSRTPTPDLKNSDDDDEEAQPEQRHRQTQQVSQGATTSGAASAGRAQRRLSDDQQSLQNEGMDRQSSMAPSNDPLVETVEQKLRAARKVATGLSALHASTREAYSDYDEKTRRFLQEQGEMRTRIMDESQAIIDNLVEIETAFEQDGRFRFSEPLVSAELADIYSKSGTRTPSKRVPHSNPMPSSSSNKDAEARVDKGKSRAIMTQRETSEDVNPFERLEGESDADYRRRTGPVHARVEREEQEAAEQQRQLAEDAAAEHRRAQEELEAHRLARQQAERAGEATGEGSNGPYRPDPHQWQGEPEEEYRIRVRNFRRINGPAPPTTPTPLRSIIRTPVTRREEVRFADGPRYQDEDPGPSISARVPNTGASAYADSDYIPPSSYSATRPVQAGSAASQVSTSRPAGWDHQDHELQLIIEMIHHHLDNEVTNSAGVAFAKNLKIEVAQYSGADDPDGFHTFMMKFIRQLRMYKLCGQSDEMEQERILALGQVLKGTAQTWFNQEYDSIRGFTRHQTFESMVSALYRRFIHTSSARVANEQYENCKWSAKDTVGGFYDRLLTAAERLRSMPDAYSLKCKFFYQLPSKLRRQAILQQRVTPEDSTMAELLDAAKWCERGYTLASNFEAEDERKTKTRSSSLKIISRDNNPSNNRPSSSRPTSRPTNHHNPSGSTRPQRDHTRSRTPRDSNPRDSTPRRTDSTPRPAASRPQGGQTQRPSDPNACYNCGKLGHWGRDCPQKDDKDKQRDGANKKRRLYAQRPVDDRSNDEQENDRPTDGHVPRTTNEDTLPEGTPFVEYSDSENGAGDYTDRSGDEGSPGEDTSDVETDSDDDNPRVGAMRLRGGCGEETEANVSDSAITVDSSDSEGDENDETATIGQSMRLRVTNRRFDDSEGEYDFESGDFVEARVEFVPDGDTSFNSEMEVEESLQRSEGEESPPPSRAPTPERPMRSFVVEQADDTTDGTVSSFEGQPGNVPTLGEAYSLGWQSALRMALTVIEAQKDDMSDQDGLGMLIKEGISRAAREVNNLLTDEPPVVNLPPPPPVGNKLNERSSKVADSILRERRRQKKRRQRQNRNERLHTAEDLLAEVAAEVAATNSESHEQPSVSMMAMNPSRERTNKEEYRPTWVYDAKIVKSGKQPVRGKREAIVLAVEIDIAGLKCYTLFDSGSTTNAISPDVAVVSKTPLVELDEPMTLQLGTVGSKSTINYGTHALAKMGTSSFEAYYDVANIDYYDAILGTPFLLQHKVILDFGKKAVEIDGQTYPALTLEQERVVRRQRRTFRRQVDEAALYARDKPPVARVHTMKDVNKHPQSLSTEEILASDVAAPPTVPPPSVSPPQHRVFGNRNVSVEEVPDEE
ncbi:uncharacterized protein STEHIDRAFT_164046 [Stereum hirsutum FP-91666 SS1]|uniref:CCHC-type domain-containing protein n=1 Tax=Stereum hirsutum (strain FP-91666) TaxID=721885 RepID=R7RVI4_STEHR|nr:uncharacterized protein STEHIDRAFT_153249 [Stereum hirsutum FP-91666 SS1]XP_007302704.1 uncharacterized protein STEHIDRAFT_155353 [Stereum hirsutum FP-91666 SS1]XP_007311841.1 uncharacterized protein STEHIDRAFT_164046 [Stereum hirsutum FP-91666 SS1]EIM79061.1 hypothetical protein STEHIDRAFT_164046 [Stereum hirsutum FP-91666 SS1]EIM87994.1 hypothetical protein STEHIDRAFT_155353 [Stereum hirsutum FP-91666 SS1]EIM91623.1 hypothetical protein STEHIDRAFT_153249 [Stereum hirsutum FP-91666 SS1]